LTYCSKNCSPENPFFKIGSAISQGKRTDLLQLREDVGAGMTLNEVYDSHFCVMAKYSKFVEKYFDLKRQKRQEPPKVYVWWGDSGTGKTKGAYDLALEMNAEVWTYMGKGWFDGYEGQQIALFDEFDGEDLGFDLWKKVCDRYPIRVPIKGDSRNWNPEIIIFTSNCDPREWFQKSRVGGDWWEQINRRVTEIKHFSRFE